jgi:hypothetical protein
VELEHGSSKNAGTGNCWMTAPYAWPKRRRISLAYSMPDVRVFAAPFSWTTIELWVAFGTRHRLTALSVDPQATPMTMFEST